MRYRYQVQLAYDGTEFHGSQFQTDLRTVQGEVEKSLEKLGGQATAVLFAGRTDAGVHAAGQVISFELDWNHSDKELEQAFNAVLPQDIAAVRIKRAGQNFHPRYDALFREYHYQILTSPIRDPLQERYCWRVGPGIELGLMRRASKFLLGRHDFAALGRPHQPDGSTVRELTRAAWKRKGELLKFEIVGNAFLYHMVRRIVMILVEIGQRKETINQLKAYLANPSGPPAQGLAPAKGLSLVKVQYE
jgi:tRNA pseudouridine38-40 synthase